MQYDESVLDNKMNVNAAKGPVFIFHPRIFTPCTIKKEQHPLLKTFMERPIPAVLLLNQKRFLEVLAWIIISQT